MTDLPLLIGSKAVPDIIKRDSLDFDFLGTNQAIGKLFDLYKKTSKVIAQHPTASNHVVLKTKDSIFEAEIAFPNTSGAKILEWLNTHPIAHAKKAEYFDVAPPVLCWMLKESHKYKDSIHFEKTRRDVLTFRRMFTIADTLPEAHHAFEALGLLDILKLRELETYRPPVKLNVSKKDFFANDGVPYIIDHDLIHELVSVDSKPAYTKIKKTATEVLCSQNLWMEASARTRVNCVIEEAMVIALERGIIPFDNLGNVDDATSRMLFKKALQKICTTLTSGWFREFAWTHYDDIINIFTMQESGAHHNYAQRFAKAYKSIK